MTSARLKQWVERELVSLHVGGHTELVRAFLALERHDDFPHLVRYVAGLRELLRRAQEQSLAAFAAFLRYMIGRTLAYPLDRPQEALPLLIELCAELPAGPMRGSTLQSLAELELLRACHKIDAPGHRDTIVAGVRVLFPVLRDDLGPCTELLDVLWRTAWWCRDLELMREGRRLAHERPQVLRFSASYWYARELALGGEHAEAAALLEGLLGARDEMQEEGRQWEHYLEVELAAAEVALGRLAAARSRLARVADEIVASEDPMLRWDLARVQANAARAAGEPEAEIAAWGRALDAVAQLGTDRLEAEFALALGEAARTAGDAEALARARRVLPELLARLKSAGELAPRARALLGE